MSRLAFLKRKIVWIPVALVLVPAVVFSFFRDEDPTTNLAFSDVVAAARDGKLQSVTVDGKELKVTLHSDDIDYRSQIDTGTDVVRALQDGGATVGGAAPGSVTVEYEGTSSSSAWFGIALWVVYLGIFGGVVYFAVLFAMRRARRDP